MQKSRHEVTIIERPRNTPLAGWWVVIGLMVFGWPLVVVSQSVDNQSPIEWRMGADLERHLEQPVSLTWTDAPLRQQLIRFSQKERIAVFIDRRIDPNQVVTIIQSDLTFDQILWNVADQIGLGVCRLGNLFYIGPPEHTSQLAVHWQQMKSDSSRLKAKSKTDWSKAMPVKWPVATAPGNELQRLSRENQFRITRSEAIQIGTSETDLPHDQWQALDLPKLPIDEQVALLVVGFGLWFEWNDSGDQIEIVPFAAMDRGERIWNLPSRNNLRDVGKDIVPELRRAFSDCKFTLSGRKLTGTGSPDQLAQVERKLVQAKSVGKSSSNTKTYSLETRATRKQILTAITDQSQLQLVAGSNLNERLEEWIDLSVKDVSLQQLIAETLKGTSIRFEIVNGRLVLSE